jgi:hypothetical protein
VLRGKLPLNNIGNTDTGDMNEMREGFYYTGSPQNLTNPVPGITEGPMFCFFVGLTISSAVPYRGIQVVFHAPNQTSSPIKIYARGALFTGWTAWKSVSLT